MREHTQTHTAYPPTHPRLTPLLFSLALALRKLTHAHVCACARTHTNEGTLTPSHPRRARPTPSDTASAWPRARASGAKARACIARPCLACVRRPVVGAESPDARLLQRNTRERRVVALRRTVVINVRRPRRVAAQMQVPVQRRHTVKRASTTRRRPPRMPTATTPEARQTPRPQSASALPHALVHARAHL